MNKTTLLLLSIFLLTCRQPGDPAQDCQPTGCDLAEELIFQTGFEPATSGMPPKAIEAFTGTDNTLPPPNDWQAFEQHANIGSFNIQYQGGDSSQRYARLVPDPLDTANTALVFWLKGPNVNNIKGRIQANVYENTCLPEIYQSVRLYLHPDLVWLQEVNFTWLTLFEYWNNANWTGEPYPFRITVNLQRTEAASGPLHLGVHGQTYDGSKWQTVWEDYRSDYDLPLGQWLTIDIYLKEGNRNNGRFYLAVTPDSGTRQTLFDITHYTHHPDDPCPDGFRHFNPFKLYTSAELLAYMQSKGAVLQVYWDDFRLWRNRQP